MTEDQGVSPSGPGSQASPGAATASPPSVSIPDAARTPGPWLLNAGNEIEIMGSNRPIARAQCGGTSGIKLDEAEANARLIAAAPELLDACRVALPLLAAFKHDDAMWACFSQMVNAMHKATVPR